MIIKNRTIHWLEQKVCYFILQATHKNTRLSGFVKTLSRWELVTKILLKVVANYSRIVHGLFPMCSQATEYTTLYLRDSYSR